MYTKWINSCTQRHCFNYSCIQLKDEKHTGNQLYGTSKYTTDMRQEKPHDNTPIWTIKGCETFTHKW